MLRVVDLGRSVNFYTQKLGMKELRREDYPDGKFTLSFVGFGDEAEQSVIELTYNYGKSEYEHGNAFGHIALEVIDIYSFCESLKSNGVTILREPGPMSFSATNGACDVISFIQDPDGYKIELIENKYL